MVLSLTIPQQLHTDFTPRITVIGVGGGGTNAVDNMISLNLQGVEFVVANTDAQQLLHSRASRRIQLGPHLTQGLGAGAKPEVGRAAADEAADELDRHLEGAHMVFITAGMGGGTGTGAAPVIARMARERGILTVGVVTKPFTFEGTRRARAADAGIEELQQYVDTLIVIPNQNLFRLANERTSWREAFKMADNVLYMGVRGVTDLMMAPGLVNLDFADIRTVMAEMGKAMMGTGEAEGENRAVRAAEAAISNPLLEDTSMSGARGLLINITGGDDMTLFEVDQAANRIREEVDEEANIIFGSAIDDTLQGKVRVSVVATGIETPGSKAAERPRLVAVGGGMPQQQAAVGSEQAAPMQQQPQPMMQSAPQPVAVGMQSHSGQPPMMRPAVVPGMPQRPVPQLRTPPMHQAAPMLRTAPPPVQAAPMPQPEMERVSMPQPREETYEQEPVASAAARPMQPQPRPAPSPARTTSRFAEPRVAGQRSGMFAEPSKTEPPPPRKSLFGIVTGAIRGTPVTPAEPAPQPAPRHDAAAAERQEQVRANVRPTGGDEMGIDIPAFLRRQSS
jgi:cell division protein FtsZ